jgi:hypothetical protein
MIKRPNLRNHGVEEGDEILIICIEKLFNKIIAEDFQNVHSNIDNHVQETFQT